MNYYEVLEIDKNATDAEVKKAYRKLAMKWHPDKNGNNLEVARGKFQEIAEAFEVLSNPEKRAVFDQYGYEGLRDGHQLDDVKGPEDIFKSFFGTENPFYDFGFGDTLPFTSTINRKDPEKAKTIDLDIIVTLEELFSGCTKSVSFKVSRIFCSKNPPATSTENLADGDEYEDSNTVSIKILKGWKSGMKITFENQGNETQNCKLGDVVCTLKQEKHAIFERDGDDLVYEAPIKLSEALTDCSITVPTLDARKLTIACNEVISPQSNKLVEGEGMPKLGNAGQRGNLKVKFHIKFPKYLTDFQKKAILKILT